MDYLLKSSKMKTEICDALPKRIAMTIQDRILGTEDVIGG